MKLTNFVSGISTCLATLGIALGASAESLDRYLSVNIGPAILSDSDTTSTARNGTGSITGDSSFENGFGINVALGTSLSEIRVEGEVSYRENGWDTFVSGGTTLVNNGYFSSLSYMANGWYDFDTGTDLVPFLGGGVGYSIMKMEVTSTNGIPSSYEESDGVFAYQVGAGLSQKVSPKVTINLSYRLFGTEEVEFVDPADRDTYYYQNHSLLFGVQFNY